jgi:hypothetical protein
LPHYTGVGSRETPIHICTLMGFLAYKLADLGYVLRSGDAIGADKAFYHGFIQWTQMQIVNHRPDMAEIYLPKEWFIGRSAKDVSGHFINFLAEPTAEEAFKIAAKVHPNWEACSPIAKFLHSRNAMQVLGRDLKTPSKKLICWAPISGESITGGTRTAWEIAKLYNVPRMNLVNTEDYHTALKFVGISEERLFALSGVDNAGVLLPRPSNRKSNKKDIERAEIEAQTECINEAA